MPAANIPYAPGAIEALAANGILALPDFVTNAGGVHLYEAPGCKDDPAACLAEIERLVADAVSGCSTRAQRRRPPQRLPSPANFSLHPVKRRNLSAGLCIPVAGNVKI